MIISTDPRIRRLVDKRLEDMNASGLKKAPDVPPDMAIGPRDQAGWIPWRAIPSTITPQQIATLQIDIGYRLPSLFVDLLLYKHFLELDCDGIKFLPLPSHEGINAVRKWIETESKYFNLLKQGYVIFALSQDDEAYYCFMLNYPQQIQGTTSIDYPVVRWNPTDKINRHGKLVFNSFADLVESLTPARMSPAGNDSSNATEITVQSRPLP